MLRLARGQTGLRPCTMNAQGEHMKGPNHRDGGDGDSLDAPGGNFPRAVRLLSTCYRHASR